MSSSTEDNNTQGVVETYFAPAFTLFIYLDYIYNLHDSSCDYRHQILTLKLLWEIIKTMDFVQVRCVLCTENIVSPLFL